MTCRSLLNDAVGVSQAVSQTASIDWLGQGQSFAKSDQVEDRAVGCCEGPNQSQIWLEEGALASIFKAFEVRKCQEEHKKLH